MINYKIKKISAKIAKEYIHKYHYSHGSHNGPFPCYGLFDKNVLIGVCMFATPCSENVRSSIFGKDEKNRVIELHRLHILDITPKNTESWFISRCFKLLIKDRSQTRAVISFSDETEGHVGTIYKALNALYYGKTSKKIFYRDKTGRLRHPRQCGVNISTKEAKELGWIIEKRESKRRYLWLLGNKSEKKYYKKLLKVNILSYNE